MIQRKNRFEIEYLDSATFVFTIWLSSHHTAKYTFKDDGQRLIDRKESHRFGQIIHKDVRIEEDRWRLFKSDFDELPIRDQLEAPAKIQRLFLWNYPCKGKSKGRFELIGDVLLFNPRRDS